MNRIKTALTRAAQELQAPVSTKYKKSYDKIRLIVDIIMILAIVFFSISIWTACQDETYSNISRYDAVKLHKPIFDKIGKQYQDSFPNCKINEVNIVLGLLLISETSSNINGKWQVLSSDLYQHNNLFGFKASKDKVKAGEYISRRTWEEVKGIVKHINDNFATFNTKEECVHYWYRKITSEKRYERVKSSRNYAEVLINLQICGYMTDSKYPQKMLQVSKKEGLEPLFNIY